MSRRTMACTRLRCALAMKKFWYPLEQFFKRSLLRALNRIFDQKTLTPAEVDFAALQRILVIRQHDMLGDFLLATPVLRALRERFPGAHLGVLVREYFAPTVEAHPCVDEILHFYEHGTHWTPRRAWALWQQLRRDWDLAVVLNTVSHSLTSDVLALLSGAKYILGSEHRVFPGCERNFFYNLLAPYAANVKTQSERNLDIVRYLGIDTADHSEIMCVIPAERKAAREALADTGWREGVMTIGMHLGAGKIMNRWPVARFAALAQRLHDDHGFQIALFWGGNEGDLSREFCARVGFAPVKIAPRALRAMAACLTHCDAVVCNDTGVMHVCAAVGVPLVAIFGPTDPAEWKPVGRKFIAVRDTSLQTAAVEVDQVYSTLLDLLKHQGKELSPKTFEKFM